MADTKISALASAAALTGAEEVAVVQSSSTVKTTVQDIIDFQGLGTPVPDSTATDVATLKNDFNTLLASLRAANVIGT